MTLVAKRVYELSRMSVPKGTMVIPVYDPETGKDYYALLQDVVGNPLGTYPDWSPDDAPYADGDRVTWNLKFWESLINDNNTIPSEGANWTEVSADIDHGIAVISAAGTNTYTATVTPEPTSYTTGRLFAVTFTNGNTAASTLNLNSLGAKAIVKNGSTALASGDIAAGQVYLVTDAGTNFKILGKIGTTGITGTLQTLGTSRLAMSTGATSVADSGVTWVAGLSRLAIADPSAAGAEILGDGDVFTITTFSGISGPTAGKKLLLTTGQGGTDNDGGDIEITPGVGDGTGRDGVVILGNLPTSATGLPSGALWNDSGTLKIA